MESKAKSGAKPAPKVEKKDSAPPPKADHVPADPAQSAKPEKPAEDGATNPEGVSEGGETAGSSCETLENLKPFLIGGAIIALGAVLVGVILLAKKK